jgi:hypothetical protein
LADLNRLESLNDSSEGARDGPCPCSAFPDFLTFRDALF